MFKAGNYAYIMDISTVISRKKNYSYILSHNMGLVVTEKNPPLNSLLQAF